MPTPWFDYWLFATDPRLAHPEKPLVKLILPYGTFLKRGEEARAADLVVGAGFREEKPRVIHDEARGEHFLVFSPPGYLELRMKMFWKGGKTNSGIFLWSVGIGRVVVEVPIVVLQAWLESGELKLRVGNMPSE